MTFRAKTLSLRLVIWILLGSIPRAVRDSDDAAGLTLDFESLSQATSIYSTDVSVPDKAAIKAEVTAEFQEAHITEELLVVQALLADVSKEGVVDEEAAEQLLDEEAAEQLRTGVMDHTAAEAALNKIKDTCPNLVVRNIVTFLMDVREGLVEQIKAPGTFAEAKNRLKTSVRQALVTFQTLLVMAANKLRQIAGTQGEATLVGKGLAGVSRLIEGMATLLERLTPQAKQGSSLLLTKITTARHYDEDALGSTQRSNETSLTRIGPLGTAQGIVTGIALVSLTILWLCGPISFLLGVAALSFSIAQMGALSLLPI